MLYMLLLCNLNQFESIHYINQVEEHLLDSFNYVAGIVPVLKHYIRSVSC